MKNFHSFLNKFLLAMAATVALSTAHATTVSYASAAALAAHSTTTTTIDFNGGSNQSYQGQSWTTSGVTFNAPAIYLISDISYDAAYHQNGYVDLEGSSLSMNFGSAVTAVGFNFGDFYSAIVALTVTLSNGDVFNISSPANAYGYFGITSNVAFSSLTISTTNLFTAFDNVTVGTAAAVPEPASLALLGLGLLGFAAARRKRAN